MSDIRKMEDVSKWANLYSNYLFNYCLVKVNDTELAKDLVQDTFIAGLQGLEKFEGKSEIRTWLISILKRKIVDYWRKKNKYQTYTMSSFSMRENHQYWQEKHRPENMQSDIEAHLFNNELKGVLKDCISLLPDKWKQVFIDKMINENTSEVVCQKNNITASNFWVIMHRSKLIMRHSLEKNWL